MKKKFMEFMRGRYGGDQLSKVLLYFVILMFILGIVTKYSIFNVLGMTFVVYGYFRIFSKNIPARYAENQKYLKSIAPIKSKFYKLQRNWKQRKEYKYLKCTQCAQELRVPKGKGRIMITCSKCKNKFEIRS